MKLQDNLIIKDSKTGKDLDKFIFKSENKNFFSSSKVINLEKINKIFFFVLKIRNK